MLQSSQIHERVQYRTPNPTPQCFHLHKLLIVCCKYLVPVSLNFVSELLHTPRFKNIFETWSLIPAFVHPLYGNDLRNTCLWACSVVKAKENLTRLLHFEINSSMHLPGIWMYLVYSVWWVDSSVLWALQQHWKPSTFNSGTSLEEPLVQVEAVGNLGKEEHLKLHLIRWNLRWRAVQTVLQQSANCIPTLFSPPSLSRTWKYYYNPFSYQESQKIVPFWRSLLHAIPGDQYAVFQEI